MALCCRQRSIYEDELQYSFENAYFICEIVGYGNLIDELNSDGTSAIARSPEV